MHVRSLRGHRSRPRATGRRCVHRGLIVWPVLLLLVAVNGVSAPRGYARSRHIEDYLLIHGPPGAKELPSRAEDDAAVLSNLSSETRAVISKVVHRSWAIQGVALSVVGMEARSAVAASPILDSLGVPGSTRGAFVVVDFPSDVAVRGLMSPDDRAAVFFAVRANFVVGASASSNGPSAREAAADLMSRQLDRLVGLKVKLRPGTSASLSAPAWIGIGLLIALVVGLALRPILGRGRRLANFDLDDDSDSDDDADSDDEDSGSDAHSD